MFLRSVMVKSEEPKAEKVTAGQFLLRHGVGLATRSAIIGAAAGGAQAHASHKTMSALRRVGHTRDAEGIAGGAGAFAGMAAAYGGGRLINTTSGAGAMRSDLRRATPGAVLAGWGVLSGSFLLSHRASFKAAHAYHRSQGSTWG